MAKPAMNRRAFLRSSGVAIALAGLLMCLIAVHFSIAAYPGALRPGQGLADHPA
jgi:hypothetical protein